MEIFLGRLSDKLWERCSLPNSIFWHEEIFEFDQRLRRCRKRERRPRYFRRSSLRHTMLARGAVFDWHRVSYIVECFKKEGTSGLRVLNNKSRSPVDFLFHTPTNTAIRIRGSLPFWISDRVRHKRIGSLPVACVLRDRWVRCMDGLCHPRHFDPLWNLPVDRRSKGSGLEISEKNLLNYLFGSLARWIVGVAYAQSTRYLDL